MNNCTLVSLVVTGVVKEKLPSSCSRYLPCLFHLDENQTVTEKRRREGVPDIQNHRNVRKGLVSMSESNVGNTKVVRKSIDCI